MARKFLGLVELDWLRIRVTDMEVCTISVEKHLKKKCKLYGTVFLLLKQIYKSTYPIECYKAKTKAREIHV